MIELQHKLLTVTISAMKESTSGFECGALWIANLSEAMAAFVWFEPWLEVVNSQISSFELAQKPAIKKLKAQESIVFQYEVMFE